ncbi:MAG: hypothetical protein M1480_06380 [Bacteroidetes bacterium]|nr:hypothetical protein [Bacteroidota bacterium]
MKTIAYLLTAILIVLISTSCSSGTYEIKEFVNEVPEWYINPPDFLTERNFSFFRRCFR